MTDRSPTAEERAAKFCGQYEDDRGLEHKLLTTEFRAAQADTASEVFDLCEGLANDDVAAYEKQGDADSPTKHYAAHYIALAIAKARETYLAR